MNQDKNYFLAALVLFLVVSFHYISAKSLASAEIFNPITSSFVENRGKIAYTFGWDIYVMSEDGSDSHCLTICNEKSASQPSTSPAWSWDSEHIAFKARRQGLWGFYVMNADGSNEYRLADYSSCSSDIGLAPPAWSPDNLKIAFATCTDGVRGIYTVNPDGSDQTLLTSDTEFIGSPAWSPDGEQIAFASHNGIVTMDADGGNLRLLVEGMSPAWSPDGEQLAFVSLPARAGAGWSIEIINSDGTGLRRLFTGSYIVDSPTWSPDGNAIAFMAQPGTETDSYYAGNIYRINLDGSGLQQLTQTGGWSPAWSPLPE